MKTMKRFAALLLVVVLMAAMLVVPANAAQETTITVTTPLAGITYNVYKMFDLSYSNGAYSYTVNSAWNAFFSTGAGKDYVTISNGYVTDISNPAALAKAAAAAVPSGAVSLASYTTSNTSDFTFSNGGESVKFGPGLYLVASSAGTAGMFDTATGESGNLVIEEKNKLPTIDKTIGVAEYVPGQSIPFTVTVTTEMGGRDYVVHDHMGSGLSYNGDVVVTLNGTPVDTSKYTVKTADLTCDVVGCKLEIVFDNEFIGSLAALTELVITYSAKMLTSGDYTNQAIITSGGGVGGDNPSTTITPTLIDFSKVTTEGKALSGAEFKLYKLGEDDAKLYATLGGAGSEADPYIANAWGTNATTITLQKFYIKALAAGTYYLEETQAPEGYNKLDKPVKIVVTENKTTDANGDTVVTYTVTIDDVEKTSAAIENKSGTELPSTGGVGTTVFYALGGIMVLAAVVVLVTRRRVTQ